MLRVDILSGAFCPDLKIGVWRRRTYQGFFENPEHLILFQFINKNVNKCK
jgi:hypothetical protein